jgi:hypothetical protein
VLHRAPSINQPTMRPAFSTFFANVAFSERKPYPVMGQIRPRYALSIRSRPYQGVSSGRHVPWRS